MAFGYRVAAHCLQQRCAADLEADQGLIDAAQAVWVQRDPGGLGVLGDVGGAGSASACPGPQRGRLPPAGSADNHADPPAERDVEQLLRAGPLPLHPRHG
jgi:hypothetical protein